MFALDQSGKVDPTRWPRSARLALLLGTLVLMAVITNTLVILADSSLR